MNIFMSLILYNPLEAMVLILPLWFLNRKNINWKNKKKVILTFIKDTYVIGCLNLIIQLPSNWMLESLLYGLYDTFCITFGLIMILFKYNMIRFKKKNLFLTSSIGLAYIFSLNLIIVSKSFYLILSQNSNKFINELFANLYIKVIQFLLLFIIVGGIKMLKSKLIKLSKKNLNKEVAATVHCFGEPKLSEKLKSEVKSSK